MTINGWVEHPPTDTAIDLDHFKPRIVTEAEVIATKESGIVIAMRKADTPVHAIESLILCHDAGLYPSLDALDWLVGALKTWHQSGGKVSMDTAMRLKAPGQAGNAMREAVRKEHKQTLMVQLNYLRSIFAITNTQAAVMIEARLAETNWNQSEHKLPTYSAETLVDDLERDWAKLFHDQKPVATDEEKRETLTYYPRHSWEHLPQMKAYL